MKKDIKEIIKDIFNILEDSYEDRTHNTYCTTVTNLNKIKKRLRQIGTLNRMREEEAKQLIKEREKELKIMFGAEE